MAGLPTKFEVITELSAQALPEIMQTYHANAGKFVRFGAVIVLGPHTDIQPQGFPPDHLEIASAAFQHPDETFRQRVLTAAAEADPALSIGADYRGMLDAGHYAFSLAVDGAVENITFDRVSATFKRSAERLGRQETGLLAQAVLGPGASVQAV